MYATYLRCNVSVAASDITVIRAARKKLRKTVQRSQFYRAERKKYYSEMLMHHRAAQVLAADWRL